MQVTFAHRQVVSFPTADFSDPAVVALVRDRYTPDTVFKRPTTVVFDLTGRLFSPAGLRELVVPLGQRFRAGFLGPAKLVFAVSDSALREAIGLLAREYQLPVYVAASHDTEDVLSAWPVGDLTDADTETLEGLRASGLLTTASSFAAAFGLQATAANNRLVNLERKGFIFRVRRGRDEGDQFVDPRVAFMTPLGSTRRVDNPPMRHALLDAGISSNPYEHPPRWVEGEPAERLANILRRRGKLR